MQSFYENLPVYKAALDLTVYFENIVRNFDRYHKYVIGTELRSLSHRILVLIAKANRKSCREENIKKAIDLLEELKILVRVCWEIKAFRAFKNFEFSSKSVVEILKQCEGWLGMPEFFKTKTLKKRAE